MSEGGGCLPRGGSGLKSVGGKKKRKERKKEKIK